MKETNMTDTDFNLRLPERARFAEWTANGHDLSDALDDWLAANPDDEALQHVYSWTDAKEREAVQ